MRKFKKASVKLIASLIAVIILISPINVLAAVIAPKIDELLHGDEYIGASDAYLANADIQADNLEYYPETADILDEDEYYYNLESNNADNEELRAASSDVVGDPMVFYTQRWLNQEYGNVSGFGSVPENGRTGWNTVYGLLRALQHELGITSLSNNFGPSTSSLYSKNQLSRKDGVTDKKYAILQFALWCKGYCPGYNISYNQSTGKVTINAVFDAEVEKAVIELKKDAGLTNPNGTVTLNVMKALMSMDSFKLLGSSYGAKAEVRGMQQEFNRKYEAYIGLIPCDGVYGRSTNSALIYAYQAEEGLPVGVANGNFGPTTRKCAPNIPYTRSSGAALTYNGSYYTDAQISTFTKLLQFALFVNGFGSGNFNGNFDGTTQQAVRDFQDFYKLTKTGKVDIGTWMSLFLSSGDPNRPALGADCAMILNEARAKTLYDNGYRYVGRYLTGTYGSNRISKALTVEEEQIILNAGLRFFPIYQDGGTRLDYFTASQGTKDGQTAIDTADKGGTVSGSGTFAYESTTTITAIPDDGYKFFAWYENGNILYNTPETYEIKINSNRKLKALFISDTEFEATVKGNIYQLTYPDGSQKGGPAPGLNISIVSLNNKYTTTSDSNGSFILNNITSGVYIMHISGESTIDRNILINVDNKITNIGEIAIACFDYIKDGIIDDKDLNAWSTWFNTGKDSEKYNPFADLNNDGFINAKDYAMLFRGFYKKNTDEINKIIEGIEN